jgi:RimJ/RimL family protein N-acetyltransferase
VVTHAQAFGHSVALEFGYWVVREKASERFVGELGFADFKRDTELSLGDGPEAGWVLVPWAHGRGFAIEALRAGLAWGEQQRGWRRTVCMIDPLNTAKIRVAEKAGYREVVRTAYKDGPTVVFERLAPMPCPALPEGDRGGSAGEP